MTADKRMQATGTTPERRSGVWLTIALWLCGWTIFIGIVGALLALRDINDAHFRAELAVRGIRAVALVTGKNCPKSPMPQLHLAGRKGDDCPAGDYPPRFRESHPAGSYIGIATLPGHPRKFIIAPGGIIPQRDVTGVWKRWLRQTLVMLALYLPATAAIILIRDRRRKHRDQATSRAPGSAGNQAPDTKTTFISRGRPPPPPLVQPRTRIGLKAWPT